MVDDREQLLQSLHILRVQLGRSDLPDEAVRVRLEQTIMEIEGSLGPSHSRSHAPVHPSLMNRLSEATLEFERPTHAFRRNWQRH